MWLNYLNYIIFIPLTLKANVCQYLAEHGRYVEAAEINLPTCYQHFRADGESFAK